MCRSRCPLPEEYRSVRVGRARLVARRDILEAAASAIAAAGSLHAFAASQPGARPLHGRGIAWTAHVGEHDCVVRHYRRGGKVARILADRYLAIGTPRPLRELSAAVRAAGRGVPTPPVLACAVYPSGMFYRAEIATGLVRDAADLATIAFGDERRDEAERVTAWAAAGALVALAARVGVHHADLNMKNILIAGEARPPTAWLVDLDRCDVRASPRPAADRNRMVKRLHRSREKLERAAGERVGEVELGAFRDALRYHRDG